MSTQAITRVTNYLWRKDGEPERVPGDPTSVGYEDYRNRAQEIITGLVEMGYTIKRPAITKASASNVGGAGGELE